jgi:hypothetical protein
MVTNRTGMEIGIVTTTVGLASEKDGCRGKDNNGFQMPNYQSIFFRSTWFGLAAFRTP